MTWQLYVGLGILFYSVNGLLHRTLMKHEKSDAFAQTIMFNVLVGLFAFAILFFRGQHLPAFSLTQLMVFVPMVVISTTATLCAFQSVKTIEASEYTILITSTKLWFIAGTLLFLHESFSLQKLAGAVAILAGVCIAVWKKQKFVFNSGALYVLFAALLYAAAEIMSFGILQNFNATALLAYSCLLSVIILLAIKPGTIKKLSFYTRRKHAANIIVVSINDTLATLSVYLAYQIGRNALQIGPLMSIQTIITVFLAVIILKEKDHLSQKLLGAGAVVIGTMLLV